MYREKRCGFNNYLYFDFILMVYEGMMVSATSNFTLLFASTLIGTDKLKQKE